VLIGVTEETVSAQPWRKKKLHRLSCDLTGCNAIWEVPYRGNRPENKLDFCCPEHKYASRRCGEKFDQKLKELSLKKWGVESPNCLEEVKLKASQTKEERWGDRNFNNRQQAEKTCLAKFGNKNPAKSETTKEKSKIAWSRNGVSHLHFIVLK
jgi:hypothetical protein